MKHTGSIACLLLILLAIDFEGLIREMFLARVLGGLDIPQQAPHKDRPCSYKRKYI